MQLVQRVQVEGASLNQRFIPPSAGYATHRTSESLLGRGFNGSASWLKVSWELGIDRVTQRSEFTVDRIYLHDSGVVPQTAA